MKKTLFGKYETIFTLVVLSVINILCLSKFLFTFIEANEVINITKLVENIPSKVTLIQVVLIISFILCILVLLSSFIFLLIKNDTAKKNMLIAQLTVCLLIILFYFILRFACGNIISTKNFYDDYYDRSSEFYIFNINHLINCLYLICSIVLSYLISILNYKISNLIYYKKETSQEIETSNNSSNNSAKTADETLLEEEIEKLKAKIRVKNLEEEYLKLKSSLDNNN